MYFEYQSYRDIYRGSRLGQERKHGFGEHVLELDRCVNQRLAKEDVRSLDYFGVRIPLLRSDLSHETGPGSL